LNAALVTAAVRPTLRAMPVGLIAGILGLAAAPTIVTAFDGGTDLDGALVAASVVAGAVAAFAVQEPAGAIAAATPFPGTVRRGVRVAALLTAVGVVGLAVVAIAAARDAAVLDERAARMAELAASAGLAVAAAAVAARLDTDAPGLGGALFGPLCVLTVSAFAFRFHWLPTVGASRDAGRWWQVAAFAWLVGAWASRDPYR
jgi:hypothetical protein